MHPTVFVLASMMASYIYLAIDYTQLSDDSHGKLMSVYGPACIAIYVHNIHKLIPCMQPAFLQLTAWSNYSVRVGTQAGFAMVYFMYCPLGLCQGITAIQLRLVLGFGIAVWH